MRYAHAQNNRSLARSAFTLTEILIVIAIIVVLLVLGAGAYMSAARASQERAAEEMLKTIQAAIQEYYNEHRDYPPMRFEDIIPKASPPLDAPWPDLNGTNPPNADQSIEALVFSLMYRSNAGPMIEKLPKSVLVAIPGHTVDDGGITRQLYTIRDPWGNPYQYIRPRMTSTTTVDYRLSPDRLNKRVLLISMGRDGQPGSEGVDDEVPGTPTIDIWQDTDGDTNTERFPDPLELGKGDDLTLLVGAIR